MALIGTFSRALLESATAVYYGGSPATVLDAMGNVVVGDTPPAPPTITSTIADRSYEIGSGPYTVDLATKFSGAGAYVVSPTNANLSLSGAVLTITPTAALAETTISVIGRNGGGDSPALTFKLTVTAAVPTLTTPLPDQSLNTGGANVTIPLDSHFSGAASYTVLPTGQGATISGRNLVLSTAAARSLEITVTARNATGQEVSDAFLFAVAQLQQAPSVTAPPTITGNTTVGSILTRTAGTATGIPAPTRSTVWLRNGTILDGQTGNTLDTAGFAAADAITTRDDWTNSQGTATGTSDPWVLTVQPAITATPPALTAGQQATITFNLAPDSVTITQGSATLAITGTGTSRSFTPLTTEPVSITALKDGYTAYSAPGLTVQPAPAAFGQTSGNRMAITGVTDGTPAITYTSATPDEWDGDYAIPTLAALADGPRAVVPPRITGTPAVGETVSLDLGLTASLDQVEPDAAWEWPDGSIGDSYVVRDEDQGTSVSLDVVFTDSRGSQTITTNALAVPAAPVVAAWWDPAVDLYAGSVHIDYENNRARINGVTYTTLAAARTATAMTANGAWDKVPITTGASYAFAARVILPADAPAGNTRYAIALDDGADGSASDNIAFIEQNVNDGQGYAQMSHNVLAGASRVSATNKAGVSRTVPVRSAIRCKAGAYAWSVNGSLASASTNAGAPPVCTEMIVGNRNDGARAWTGTILEAIYINGDLDDAQLNALLGA